MPPETHECCEPNDSWFRKTAGAHREPKIQENILPHKSISFLMSDIGGEQLPEASESPKSTKSSFWSTKTLSFRSVIFVEKNIRRPPRADNQRRRASRAQKNQVCVKQYWCRKTTGCLRRLTINQIGLLEHKIIEFLIGDIGLEKLPWPPSQTCEKSSFWCTKSTSCSTSDIGPENLQRPVRARKQ